MRPTNCYYCDLIGQGNDVYRARPAEFDLPSEAPRCAWHWRMVCDMCDDAGHYMTRFYCATRDKLLCKCTGVVSVCSTPFEPWLYYWVLSCPACGEDHPSLDYAERVGEHPWQTNPLSCSARRWLSSEPYLSRYNGPPASAPQANDKELASRWTANAQAWNATYDECGDRNRRYQSDPVLMQLLGDVAGKRVLDAGSGTGYLARILAMRGASVVAVEFADEFHEIALQRHERDNLAVDYRLASIENMGFLADESMDAVVANYVLMNVRDMEHAVAEIGRVTKGGGVFVFTVTHGTVDGRWHMPARDSPRKEDRAGWIQDNYFVRRGVLTAWPGFQPVIAFHRPLRDYLVACRNAGFQLRELDEPEVSEEGRQSLPPSVLAHLGRLPYSYAVKMTKSASTT